MERYYVLEATNLIDDGTPNFVKLDDVCPTYTTKLKATRFADRRSAGHVKDFLWGYWGVRCKTRCVGVCDVCQCPKKDLVSARGLMGVGIMVCKKCKKSYK